MAQKQTRTTKPTTAQAPAMPGTVADQLTQAAKKPAKTQAKGAKPAAKKKAAPVPTFKASIKPDASAAEVQKFITSIQTRGARLDNDMHSAALACLHHAEQHGDITLMNRLILAVPKATRKNALTVWAMAFGKFALNDDKTTQKTQILAYAKEKKTDMEQAQAKPFWEFRGVREGGSEWLYMDYIGNVMKKLASVASDVQNPEHRKAKAALDALTAVNEALAAPATPAPTGTAEEEKQWQPGDADRRGTPAVH